MKVISHGVTDSGARSVEIPCNESSFDALVRCMRAIPGVLVSDTAHDPLNDNAKATIHYKGAVFTLDTPFSDYWIHCAIPTPYFDEFLSHLKAHRTRWWERFF